MIKLSPLPSSKELKTNIQRSCTYLFAAYHFLQRRLDHTDHREVDSILVPWTYQISSSHETRPSKPSPPPIDISLNTEVRGWNESYAVFDELGMPKGERTETFLVAFLSCWLSLFILLVRDAGCIHPGTFVVASSMEGGQAYCLFSAISC